MPYEEPRKLPLADAVLAALQHVDRVKRVGATIVRENGDRIGHARMVAIHDRPDFPRRQHHGRHKRRATTFCCGCCPALNVAIGAAISALWLSFRDILAGLGAPVHDDQGTFDRPYDLVVRFDHAKIDKALIDPDEPLWRAPRPQVVPVLAVRGFTGTYLLSAEIRPGVDQRASLSAAAMQYGLNLRMPTEAELAAWGVTLDGFPSPRAESEGEQILVAGTLEFDEAKPGWVGLWRMRWRGVDYAWGISGVNFDEAFRALMRGVARVASGHGAPD